MNVRSQTLEWILVSSYSPPFHFNRISFLWFHSDQSSFKIIIASRLKGSSKAAQSAADYLDSYQSICKIGIWSAKTSPSDSQDLTPSDSEGNYGPSKPASSSWAFLQGEPWIKTGKRRPKKKKKTALREIFLHHSEERHSLLDDIWCSRYTKHILYISKAWNLFLGPTRKWWIQFLA